MTFNIGDVVRATEKALNRWRGEDYLGQNFVAAWSGNFFVTRISSSGTLLSISRSKRYSSSDGNFLEEDLELAPVKELI